MAVECNQHTDGSQIFAKLCSFQLVEKKIMYGWIHQALHQLVVRKYGAESWSKIVLFNKCYRSLAGLDVETVSILNRYHDDDDTRKLVSSVASALGVSMDDVWESYGKFLITFTMENGWDDILRALASDLKGFLDNLDALHYFIDHTVFNAGLKGPSFRCDYNEEDDSLCLHYYSERNGLYPIVKGIVREACRQLFNLEIMITVQERSIEHIERATQNGQQIDKIEEHVVLKITDPNNEAAISGACGKKGQMSKSMLMSSAMLMDGLVREGVECRLDLADFVKIFPYHICFDSKFTVQHCGISIKKLFPQLELKKTRFTDLVTTVHPDIALTFDNLASFINSIFVFQLNLTTTCRTVEIQIKGQMVRLDDEDCIVFLSSPYVNTVKGMLERGLYFADLPLCDGTRDMILLNQSRIGQLELTEKMEQMSKDIKTNSSELEVEKSRTEALLKELLPPSVAHQLSLGLTVEAGVVCITEYDCASIVFTDIVTFTNICGKCTAIQVVALLNDLYVRFDRLTGINKMYKVETIGDAYMVVGGLPEKCENHVIKAVNMAIGMVWETQYVMKPFDNAASIQIRAGVHSGPVVAGVVGQRMPRYCLFGNTVTIANQIESSSKPMRVNLSRDTYRLLECKDCFQFEDRGPIRIPNAEPIHMYFVIKSLRQSLWEITQRERCPTNTIDGFLEFTELASQASLNMDKSNAAAAVNPRRVWNISQLATAMKFKNLQARVEPTGPVTQTTQSTFCVLI